MATPTMITVSGTAMRDDGIPDAGAVIQFKRPLPITHLDGTVYEPLSDRTTAAADGTFTIRVVPCDEPGWVPINWTHLVTVKPGDGSKPWSFSTFLTYADTAVTFGELSQVTSPPMPQLYSLANHTHPASTPAWTDITGKPTFAPVATSGSYVDLTSKPTIPATKADIGLGNVDNTSDALKPISAATLIGLAQARRAVDNGLAGWMWPGDQVQGSFVLPTAGVGHVFRMRVFTTTVSAIGIHVVTPGSGLTAGQCFATLHNDAGAILGTGAITADQSGQWNSGGAKIMPLAVGQGGLVPGDYYKVRLWFNGTTGPALSRAGSSNTVIINYNLAAPNLHYSTADTGLTDVTSGTVTKATIGAMTGANIAMFCALHP